MADVVILSPKELEQLVERAVDNVLARHRGNPAKQLLDQRGLCTALSIGRKKLRELLQRGMPEHRIGAQSPRYDAAECAEWIKKLTDWDDGEDDDGGDGTD